MAFPLRGFSGGGHWTAVTTTHAHHQHNVSHTISFIHLNIEALVMSEAGKNRNTKLKSYAVKGFKFSNANEYKREEKRCFNLNSMKLKPFNII